MRYLIAGIILILGAILMLALGIMRGEGGAGVIVIFPFFYGTGILSFVAVLLLLGAMFLFFYHFALKSSEIPYEVLKSSADNLESTKMNEIEMKDIKRERKVSGGGVILVGPIPIIFGTSPRIAKNLTIFAIVLMLLAIIFILLLYLVGM